MPLPANFSHTEHLQDAIKRAMNKEVAKFFRDLGDEDWEPNINSSRASARTACTHQELDTISMTVGRLLLFRHFVNGGSTDVAPVYGIPIQEHQAVVRFKPQLMLFFQQRIQDVTPGDSPITGRISVRLNKESEQLTESDLKNYAQNIRRVFGGKNGYAWKKGRKMFTYVDSVTGHNFRVLCQSSQGGKALVSKAFDLIGDAPDWSKANFKESQNESEAYPSTPPRKTILAKSRKGIRRRPIATVYFQYAVIHIHGIPNAIPLYDRSGAYPKSLLREYGN